MIPEPIKKEAKALRTALEAGEINTHSLRAFFLSIEKEPVNIDPEAISKAKYMAGFVRKAHSRRSHNLTV